MTASIPKNTPKGAIFGIPALIKEFSDRVASKQPAEPDLVPIARTRAPEPELPQIWLTPWINALAEVAYVPKSMALNSLVSALCAATQAHGDVVLPIMGGHRIPLSLYALTVAHTGDRKSGCDGLAMKGIRDVQKSRYDEFEAAREQYTMQLEAWEIQRKDMIKEYKDSPELSEKIVEMAASKPQAPRSPILLTNDATPEGIYKEMLTGQRTLMLSTDEGGAFFGGYSMNDANRKKAAAAFYNDAWSGKDAPRLRAANGATVLRGYRFCMHVLIQPKILEEAWKDPDLQESGFWGRFLVAAPDSLWGTRFEMPRRQDPKARESLAVAMKRIEQWQEVTKKIAEIPHPTDEQGTALNPTPLTMTEAAQELYFEFLDECEGKGGKDGEYAEIRALSIKAAEHAARLAGCFQVFLNLGDNSTQSEIGAEVMDHAISLMRWYLQSAIRMMQAPATSEDTRLQEIFEIIQKRADSVGYDELTTADLVRATRKVRNASDATIALEELRKNGLVELVGEAIVDGKKRKEVWRVIRGG